MRTAAMEERELKIERKNRRLGVVLMLFALALMTVSFVLMKIFHFIPTPPK
ncbi:MAG: hypothetical protein L0196_05720 [candidate division Zixibacteria bacterium]|nr:hypothetical protein [candidate division Zixibacteria bacterium]